MAFQQQSGVVEDGLYDFGRENGAPSYYDENHTPWMADIIEAGIIAACVILLVSFYSILPGIHGKERFFNFLWVTASVFVGGVIVVVIFSKEWEVAESMSTVTKYKAGTGEDITATIGIHIGLKGVNVTLKGEPEKQLNETINYNEEYDWTWRQGRIGFGPFASEFNQEYRASQFRGTPLPILWIAEYFTFDGEGIRWGRFYRVAGLYSFMCLWLAFGLWLLTNILCFILLRYAAYSSILTGAFMISANIIKHTLRNVNELEIPFSTDHILQLKYGVAFWLCLATGIFCVVAGLIVFLMDLRFPVQIAKFFGQDNLQDKRFLEREATSYSQTSEASTSTTDTNLTEIVEVDGDGNRVVKRAARPQGAPSSKGHETHTTNFGGKALDDVFGEDDSYWSDCSLYDTDSEISDDEKPEPVQRPQSRGTGIFKRFQQPRRPNTAANRTRPKPAADRKANLKAKRQISNTQFLGRGKVSPTGAHSKTTKVSTISGGKLY